MPLHARRGRLALYLTHKHATLSEIQNRAWSAGDREWIQALRDGMFQKGAIASKALNGEQGWCLMPLVVGMFEGQVGKLTRRFALDDARHMRSLSYGRLLIAAKPSQMRTIPVNTCPTKSTHLQQKPKTTTPPETKAALYDEIKANKKSDLGELAMLLKLILRMRQ